MEWANVLCAYILMSSIVFMFTIIILDVTNYKHKDDFFKSIFVFQYELHKNMKDKLNILGIIILEVLITLLTFGASAFMFATNAIVWLFILIWELFYFVFKKR